MALEIVSKGFRLLAVQLHPDKGGSTEAMQRLNSAADWLRATVSRALPTAGKQ